MQQALRILILAFASAMLTGGTASAGDIVVPPILARGAPSQAAANMTTLVASELEFTGEFDTVHQLSSRPSQLGTNCLGSSPCLAGIAKSKGASDLIAGKVTKYGPEFEVVLTFLTGGKIARTVKRRMPTDPAAVADEIAFLVRHAVTGVDPAKKAEADKVSGFEGGGIALMDDEEEDDDDDLLLGAPEVPVSDDPMGGGDEDLFADDPVEEDDDYGIRGSSVGGLVAPAPVIDDISSPADDTAFDDAFGADSPESISFGSASAIIEVEEEDDSADDRDRYTDEAEAGPVQVRTPRQRAKRQAKTPRTPRNRTPRARGPQRSTGTSSVDVRGRIGFAKFQFLNFLTYGVDADLQVTPTIAVIAGLEAYSTRRAIPPELVPEGMPAVQWNTLIPFHVAGVYRPSDAALRPFVGAGAQLIPGYVKDSSSLAFGLRAIGGADYALSDTMSLTASASAGFWAGSEWYLIQNLLNTGFSGQLSAGAVVKF